jgi:glycosyltransferase involved in cell wall biosynthesis
LTGVSLASLHKAKRQGALTILESPMVHLHQWQEQVLAECNHFGVKARNCGAILPMPIIHRAQREYEVCDRIQVLSSVARRSFERLGYAHKTVVIWPGVDHFFYRPSVEPRPPRLFRACYVGRVELAKGIGYLLEAWKRLALPNAELLLVGEIRPEINFLLRDSGGANVRLAGILPPEEVAKCYRESSLLVFPSVNEGFGLVLLEAMASGLPVAATDKSGAEDCITQGKDGFVVPARNVDALAETILWYFRHRDETLAMGRAARVKVEQQFTLSHYEERQIALYRSYAKGG